MKEINREIFADKMETVGGYAAGLGLVGAVVSGIAFIASEPNLSAEAVQRLSTQVNGFFEVALASVFVSGAGATVSMLGETIRKK